VASATTMHKLFVVAVLLSTLWCVQARYTANWTSLDARPLPAWYDQAKFGIFVHWGVFSVPSYGGCKGSFTGASGEWYWYELEDGVQCIGEYHNKTYGPDFKYEDFAPMFKTSLFTPDDWATLFKQSGAQYVVLTSKHHDGYCNWPSAQSWNWNSFDTGPHQDNVKMVADAVRKQGLHMGLYHSLFEWFNPLYLSDRANNATTRTYVEQVLWPQLKDIVNNYKPEVLWADGDWEQLPSYWGSEEFLAWLYNDSPVADTVCTNDRWGKGTACTHGGYWTCDDRYNPGHLVPHKWENCLTLDTLSWGYRRNQEFADIMTIEQVINELVVTVSCGGNMLLNVGPTSDGMIVPIFQERLTQIGQWLYVNGEAIYGTKPWRVQNETNAPVWYTQANGAVYAIILDWPADNKIVLAAPRANQASTVNLLGYNGLVMFSLSADGMTVLLPDFTPDQMPSEWAWTLKLLNVK